MKFHFPEFAWTLNTSEAATLTRLLLTAFGLVGVEPHPMFALSLYLSPR